MRGIKHKVFSIIIFNEFAGAKPLEPFVVRREKNNHHETYQPQLQRVS